MLGHKNLLTCMNKNTNADLHLPILGKGRKSLWSYVSLVFSLFYLLPLFLTESQSQLKMLGALLVYFLLLGSYLIAINSEQKYRTYWILLLTLISILAVPFNIGGLSLFGYSFFVMAYYWPFKKSLSAALALTLMMIIIPLALEIKFWQFVIPVIISSIALYSFGVMEQRETLHNIALKQSHDSIKKLSAIAERERIGRDLHDIAGHALSGISLKAQLASKLMSKNQIDKAQHEVDQLALLSQSLLSEIRKAVTHIKELSLQDEIEKIEKTLIENTITLNKEIDELSIKSLTPAIESAISLVLKEAMTNVLRHSNANMVDIKLCSEQRAEHWAKHKCIVVYIKDNGNISNQHNIHKSNGVAGMQERIELIGGKFAIDFEQGCSICIEVPLS